MIAMRGQTTRPITQMTIREIVKIARERGACPEAEELFKFRSLKEIEARADQVRTSSDFMDKSWEGRIGFWAYWWALHVGDCDYLRQFVTGQCWAYHWAKDIGDQEHMRQFVTGQCWAYRWARDIGDQEHMRQFVTDPEWAYLWAKDIGDLDHMRGLITDPYWRVVLLLMHDVRTRRSATESTCAR